MKFTLVFLSFLLVHCLVWFSTNLQLIDGFNRSRALVWCVILAIPTSLAAYFATRVSFDYFDSAWSARLVGHGTSYLVFPALTWILLSESPFTAKTMICIFLSLIIVAVQVFYPS